jgi:hypothetical protein
MDDKTIRFINTNPEHLAAPDESDPELQTFLSFVKMFDPNVVEHIQDASRKTCVNFMRTTGIEMTVKQQLQFIGALNTMYWTGMMSLWKSHHAAINR